LFARFRYQDPGKLNRDHLRLSPYVQRYARLPKLLP
jgi:hypothetical protein